MEIGSIPIEPRAQLREIVVRDLRAEGLNGTSGLNRVAEKIVDDILGHHTLLESWKSTWDEGFDACANWWEIHHHGVVRDERNPYAQARLDRGSDG